MKKQKKRLIFPLLLMGLFLVFASSCKKDDDNNNGGNENNAGIPVLTTASVTDITQTTAKSGGNITSDGDATVTARGVCWSTGQTPTISDNKTTDGTGAGNFISNISGLSANTTYYVRAYATNSNGTGYGSTISFPTQDGGSAGSFTDPRDGNIYQTVTIGNQLWMAENLKYLPSVVLPSTGSNTTPYYYVYNYYGTNVNGAKATAVYTTYGVLYNWPAAMNGAASSTANPSGVQGVCPPGWHLPSKSEWTQLIDYLDGSAVAGGKLKEEGTVHWNSPNTGATNSSGFTAFGGGYRSWDGTFKGYHTNGTFWSSTDETPNPNFPSASYLELLASTSKSWQASMDKNVGMSVRCVKD